MLFMLSSVDGYLTPCFLFSRPLMKSQLLYVPERGSALWSTQSPTSERRVALLNQSTTRALFAVGARPGGSGSVDPPSRPLEGKLSFLTKQWWCRKGNID